MAPKKRAANSKSKAKAEAVEVAEKKADTDEVPVAPVADEAPVVEKADEVAEEKAEPVVEEKPAKGAKKAPARGKGKAKAAEAAEVLEEKKENVKVVEEKKENVKEAEEEPMEEEKPKVAKAAPKRGRKAAEKVWLHPVLVFILLNFGYVFTETS